MRYDALQSYIDIDIDIDIDIEIASFREIAKHDPDLLPFPARPGKHRRP